MSGRPVVQLALPECCLPGCHLPVQEDGEPCPSCRAAFGSWLAPSTRPASTHTDFAARDAAVLAILRARRPAPAVPAALERKANQRCWLCEERRTCVRTPQGWECPTCQEVR